MARLIDAEFIEKWINREEHNTPDERWRPESEFAAMVDNAPTADAVEVVRCEDCEYFMEDIFKRTVCNRTFDMFVMQANDFCSYGKRKIRGDKE